MNYWILQSNPLKFPILKELRLMDHSYWHISRYEREIQPGDTAFIWKSSGGDKGTRGVYAPATVLSVSPNHKEPYTPESIDEEEAKLGIDWFDEKERIRRVGQPTVVLEYGKRLLDEPLLASELRVVPTLEVLSILKEWPRGMYQRGIHKLTEEQGRTIEKMIESR